MNITVTARHLRVTEDMKARATECAQRMWKYFDRISKIEVVLDVDGDKYAAEMIVTAAHHVQCVGHAKDTDIHTALDKVAAKLERQLTKVKEKLLDHRPSKGSGGTRKKVEAREPAAADEEDWW